MWVSALPSEVVAVSCPSLEAERRVLGVAGATRRDLEDVLALAATVPVRPAVEVVPLFAAEEGLVRIATGRAAGSVVLRIAEP